MLLKYINGELSGLERNQIERHLSTCEMCSDELEGLLSMQNPRSIDEVVRELNRKIDTKIDEEKTVKSIWPTIIKVAASFALLIGISSLIYFTAFRNGPDNLVSNIEMLEIQVPSTIVDSSKISQEVIVGGVKRDELKKKMIRQESVSRIVETKQTVDSQPSQIRNAAPVVADSTNIKLADKELGMVAKAEVHDTLMFAAEDVALDEKVVVVAYGVSKKEASEKNKIIARRSVANMDAASGAAVPESQSFQSNYRNQKEKAIDQYNSKKYSEALSSFRELIRDYQSNDTLIYYTALCNYHLSKFKEAIHELTPLIDKPQGEFYSKAKWYYALSLIGDKKIDDAKRILEQIIRDDSTFHDLAVSELEKLKEKK